MRDAWEIARLTGAELGAAYADGSLSPTEVVAAALAVVDDAEPELNALWDRADESASGRRGGEHRTLAAR